MYVIFAIAGVFALLDTVGVICGLDRLYITKVLLIEGQTLDDVGFFNRTLELMEYRLPVAGLGTGVFLLSTCKFIKKAIEIPLILILPIILISISLTKVLITYLNRPYTVEFLMKADEKSDTYLLLTFCAIILAGCSKKLLIPMLILIPIFVILSCITVI